MSTPSANDATQQIADSTKTPQTLEEQLATAEKRRLDTQASFTKGQQTIKALEAEKAELLAQLAGSSKLTLSTEQQKELDKLKYDEPDAWRAKMNQLEDAAKSDHQAKLATLTGDARQAAETQFELDRRQQVLKEFNDSTDIAITDEVIANEVPPRITKKLENGEISFEDFLREVSTYIHKGKVIGNEVTLDQPNLGQMSGGKTPKDATPDKTLNELYSDDIY